MKVLKTLGIALAVVVLLAGAAVAYLVASFDGARVKQELAAVVQAKTGRVLSIEGDLSLSLWPNLGINLGKISLSEPDGKTVFAKLEQARVAVAVMPLLAKQVSVKAVEVDGLAANLVKHADGSLNIDDLTGGKKAEGEAKPDAKPEANSGGAPSIDVASIRITRGQVDWRDQQAGKHVSLANLDLSSGNLQMAEGRLKVEAFKLQAQGKLDDDSFSIGAEIPKLLLAPEGANSEIIKLMAGLEGKGKKLAATVTVKGVAGSAQNLKVEQFALEANVESGETRLAAQLASPVSLDMAGTTVSLAKLAGKLDMNSPQLPMKSLSLPLAGSAEANWGKSSAKGQVATQLDASHINAKVELPAFSPLAVIFDLEIDQLDLDKYLPPAQAEKPAAGGAGSGGSAGLEAKINLAGLKSLNLKGDVRIGQLVAHKLKVSALKIHADAQGGRVNLAPMSANLYEGRLEGAVGVDANSNQFSVRQNLSGIQINPLLKDLAGKDMLEGKGNVSLDVQTRGDTVSALKKALGGSARLALNDGAIKGINIGQKLREAKALLKGGQDSGAAADANQKTDFSELSASFRIAGGVAHNDDLMAKSPLLRLAGSGDIDIGNELLNYLLKASVVNTATGQGGREMDNLKGLTVPVRLTGPFAQPAWKLEMGNLVQDAAKAKVEEKKEELKQKASEQLQGQLKGLFK